MWRQLLLSVATLSVTTWFPWRFNVVFGLKGINVVPQKWWSSVTSLNPKKGLKSSMIFRIKPHFHPCMFTESIYKGGCEGEVDRGDWSGDQEPILLDRDVLVQSRDRIPASHYVLLDEQELLKRCYNMYVAETIKSEEKVKELKRCYIISCPYGTYDWFHGGWEKESLDWWEEQNRWGLRWLSL